MKTLLVGIPKRSKNVLCKMAPPHERYYIRFSNKKERMTSLKRTISQKSLMIKAKNPRCYITTNPCKSILPI